MNFLRRMLSSARTLFQPRRTTDELSEEIEFHLDTHVQDLVAPG